MKSMRALKYLLVIVVAAGVVWLLESAVFAQCAMCRASLAGSNNPLFIRNLNIGVLVLLVPPVTIFCSIFIVLRRRKTEDSSGPRDPDR